MEFDWQSIFLLELDMQLALEIGQRTTIMFLLALTFLRLSGKKGVRELSILDIAVLIALSSAAGDLMAIKDYAILPSVLVFVPVIGVYRSITYTLCVFF